MSKNIAKKSKVKMMYIEKSLVVLKKQTQKSIINILKNKE